MKEFRIAESLNNAETLKGRNKKILQRLIRFRTSAIPDAI